MRTLGRRLRQAPGVNALATLPVRALCGDRWEWAIRHLPRSGRVRARLPNGATLALWSKGDDWVSNQVFWRGWSGYEPSPCRCPWSGCGSTFA